MPIIINVISQGVYMDSIIVQTIVVMFLVIFIGVLTILSATL